MTYYINKQNNLFRVTNGIKSATYDTDMYHFDEQDSDIYLVPTVVTRYKLDEDLIEQTLVWDKYIPADETGYSIMVCHNGKNIYLRRA